MFFSNESPYSFTHSSINANSSVVAFHSPLLPPNSSERNSRQPDFSLNSRRMPVRQPIRNQHLLSRTEDQCLSHLTEQQRKKWIKAGQEAQRNHHLLSILSHFHWPQSNYDPIIYVHYHTPISSLQGVIHRISQVRIFTIDTESDKPTIEFPNSRPALLQIKAIHNPSFSTVLLIEIQFLPDPHTELFQVIQTLCRTIFSSTNTVMAWGDLQQELGPLLSYNLFDYTSITQVINLQEKFTTYWNKTHPHTDECIAQRHHPNDDSNEDDVLICLVNTDDLDEHYDVSNIYDDYSSCICPSDLRPYKIPNAVWKLQTAIHYVFNQALNKSLKFNIWSCGLDPQLYTSISHSDRITREALTTYAINDVFAPTQLFFHIQSSSAPIRPPPIQPYLLSNTPSFLIISDSQGKFFPPFHYSQHYHITIKSISGLQWFNPYDSALSVHSVLASTPISSLLSTCTGVIFLIDTNSIRQFPAATIVHQVEVVIDQLQLQHTHLNSKTTISIIPAFPCYKLSSSFRTSKSLSFNIEQYNQYLHQLSIRKSFSILTVPILPNQLSHDGMHIHVNNISNVYTTILHQIENSLRSPPPETPHTFRSLEAKSRRNKKRHQKLRERQRSQVVSRNISRIWELNDLKAYLQHRNIRYAHLPEIYNHQLHIQFTHRSQQEYAERILSFDAFNDDNYYNWISRNH